MTSQEFAEAEERLGANVSASNSGDRSYAMLNALSPNLAPSLDLLSDVVLRPAFTPAEIERVKAQALTGIAQLKQDPTRVASRLLPVVLYGASHPYGGPAGGDPEAIKKFTRDDLVGFQQRWLRPDNREDLHRFEPAVVRSEAAARRALRQMDSAAGAQGHQEFHRHAAAAGGRRRSCSSTGPERRNRASSGRS